MAEVEPKLVVLILWCSALTLAVLGMVCYVVTNDNWSKDCRPAACDKQMEGEPNRTPQQPQLPTPPASRPPCSKESPQRDCQEATGNRKVPKLPLAHLTAAAGGLVNSSMRWKSLGRESALQAMSCRGEAIVIPEQGHYYVYSQVSFVGRSCENGSEVLENTLLCAHPQPQDRRQRQRQQHPLELMQATQTVCQGPNNKPWYHSLHQGGLHWLQKDTHISVKIRPLHRAELEHHKTFFGAFKLQ